MKKTTIQVGDKFGMLTVLSKQGKLVNKPRRVVFNCKCDCGNTKLIDAGNLKKPGIRSCGCIRKQQAREKGKKQRTQISYLNYIYGNYKRGAKNRKLEFTLGKIDVLSLIKGNCFYCNSPPIMRGINIVGIEFKTNGIDRKDNSKGYIKDNCVSCCKTCNTMKLDLTLEQFYNHIAKLVIKSLPNISKAKGWLNE